MKECQCSKRALEDGRYYYGHLWKMQCAVYVETVANPQDQHDDHKKKKTCAYKYGCEVKGLSFPFLVHS